MDVLVKSKTNKKTKKMINLYSVQCVASYGGTSKSSYEVYVLAFTPNEAAQKALEKMRELDYKYTSRVDEIKLLASDYQYGADKLLVHSITEK